MFIVLEIRDQSSPAEIQYLIIFIVLEIRDQSPPEPVLGAEGGSGPWAGAGEGGQQVWRARG